MLGYLSTDAPLAGGVELDPAAAERAIGTLATDLGLSPQACAEGIIRVANAEMIRALRVVTVDRGIDPRRYALLAFGGAGPLHAAAIADELGIERILCPRASGVLAALGLVVSPRRRDAQRTVLMSGESLNADAVVQAAAMLGEQARTALRDPNAELSASYDLRYRGQAFELTVSAGLEPDPDELRRAFEQLHEERYGYRAAEQTLELVTIRVSAIVPGIEVELADSGEHAALERGIRVGVIGGSELEIEVLRGSPPPGTAIGGPAIVELPESTLLVTPGWSGEVDASGTIRLTRRA
jgi:N-methylhydantoinase A